MSLRWTSYVAHIRPPKGAQQRKTAVFRLKSHLAWREPKMNKMNVVRIKFGEHAFSYAGPAAWNSLPADLRVIQETAAFRRRLKTHCFNMAFNTK